MLGLLLEKDRLQDLLGDHDHLHDVLDDQDLVQDVLDDQHLAQEVLDDEDLAQDLTTRISPRISWNMIFFLARTSFKMPEGWLKVNMTWLMTSRLKKSPPFVIGALQLPAELVHDASP